MLIDLRQQNIPQKTNFNVDVNGNKDDEWVLGDKQTHLVADKPLKMSIHWLVCLVSGQDLL